MKKVVWQFLFLTLFIDTTLRAQHQIWVGTWAASPVGNLDGSNGLSGNVSIREIVHLSLGGRAVRIQLSNEFGAEPLVIGSAHLAMSAGSDRIEVNTDHTILFGGDRSAVIQPGTSIISDPVNIEVGSFTDLAVSLYLPAPRPQMSTGHPVSNIASFVMPGDVTARLELGREHPIFSWPIISEVAVSSTQEGAFAVVALGDSITDGWRSSLGRNLRWPDVLARRLQPEKPIGVLNEGISGNSLMDGKGQPSALARFSRDVVSRSNVKIVILEIGINDILATAQRGIVDPHLSSHELIFNFSQLIERAHNAKMKAFCATILPFRGAGHFSVQGEVIRRTVNRWMRQARSCDAVLDFDQAVRDPVRTSRMSSAFDSGDHLHPNDVGYKAIADSIRLELFR